MAPASPLRTDAARRPRLARFAAEYLFWAGHHPDLAILPQGGCAAIDGLKLAKCVDCVACGACLRRLNAAIFRGDSRLRTHCNNGPAIAHDANSANGQSGPDTRFSRRDKPAG
jgi:hypothetical protein